VRPRQFLALSPLTTLLMKCHEFDDKKFPWLANQFCMNIEGYYEAWKRGAGNSVSTEEMLLLLGVALSKRYFTTDQKDILFQWLKTIREMKDKK